MKKFNKKVIAHYEKQLDNENFEVYILEDKLAWDGKGYNDGQEGYYNIHIISENTKLMN